MPRTVLDAGETVRKEIQTWDSPFVELYCFGTDNAVRIVEMTNAFCQAHLGSIIHGHFFYRTSIGSTHGVRLEDGREVVIKVRPPRETNPHLSPQRHSKLFDFVKTAKGAEWIDTFARRARQAEAHEGMPVLGHADWRVEHLRFEDGRIVATYDCDSLGFRPETDEHAVLQTNKRAGEYAQY